MPVLGFSSGLPCPGIGSPHRAMAPLPPRTKLKVLDVDIFVLDLLYKKMMREGRASRQCMQPKKGTASFSNYGRAAVAATSGVNDA